MISAYIMPHPPIARPSVGRGEEKKIQNTLDAYRKASRMIKEYAPETIVIVSPHNLMYRDAFYIAKGTKYRESLAQFGAPEDMLELDYDTELIEEIEKLFVENDIPAVCDERGKDRPDHGTAVPLLFVNEAYSRYKVVRIAPCLLENETLFLAGKLIERAAAHVGRKCVFLASGDLSHKLRKDGPYGLAPEGPEFDARITQYMREGDLKAFCSFDDDFLECAAECGLPGFIMMAGALADYDIVPDFLSYEGTFGVGYAICAYQCKDRYVKLAEESVHTYVRMGKRMRVPKGLPASMTETKAGVFVSIHKKNGDLRGCIGTILPCYSCVAEEVIRLAVEACSADPRFSPVREDELEGLVINVDVLSSPESADRSVLDAKRYGVIVTNGYRRGLLLPDLEGVDTPEEQIEISLQKAGIMPWEDYLIERFTVERHT